MSQRAPVPDADTFGRLALVQNPTGFLYRDVGAGERRDEIVLRAEPDGPADTAQHAVDLVERAVSIEIKHRQSRRLRAQFFVGHFDFPLPPFVEARGKLTTNVRLWTQKTHALDFFPTRPVPCAGIGNPRTSISNSPESSPGEYALAVMAPQPPSQVAAGAIISARGAA